MKISIGFNLDMPIPEIVEYSKLAESVGFEGIWLHEHSFGRDAVSNLSAVSLSTKSLKLGFGCLSPYVRNPVSLAMTAATLQEASGGRLRLGIGTGFPARLDLMGIGHPLPVSALKETIEISRMVWSGIPTTYAGKSFNVKNVKSQLGETKPKIPIYVAAWKPQMLKLTALHADGYLAKGGESTNSVGHLVSKISSYLSQRPASEIDFAAYLLTLVSGTKEDAIAKAKRDPFVAYMLSVQEDYLYVGTGIDPALKKPIAENYFRGNISGAFDAIKDEMVESFMLVGTADQVNDRVREYSKAGLTQPILQPISLKPDDVKAVVNAGSILIGS